MIRKVIAYILIGLTSIAAIIQWWQLIYRLHLFMSEYSMRLGVNHIVDGGFNLIYRLNGIFFVVGLVGISLVKFEKKKFIPFIPLYLNILGCLTFFLMHRSGVLVEYMEMIGKTNGVR